MAMSLSAGYRRGLNRRSLTCGVCHEVFRSPRLLPCHHSFCLDCVEGLISVQPPVQVFPCPHCRKPTHVPKDGALGFQLNFYIPEEDLELERNAPQITTCPEPNHEEDPLLFFCVPCDKPICLRCKVTKHENHETQDLPEAAARCSSHLEASKGQLDVAINHLSKVSAETYDNLEVVRLKESALVQEAQARRDAIVARVDKWRDGVVGDIQQCSHSITTQLTQDAQNTQRRLDSLVQLRQRLNHALSAASDVEKVRMEKEMRQGEGSEKELSKVREWVPATTLRPVVLCDLSLFTDDTIHHWLGSAVCFSLPFAATASEVLSPIYQCGQDGACREVHSICYGNENNIYISFGGVAPYYDDEKQVVMDDKGSQLWSGCKAQGKIFFQKYNNSMYYSQCRLPDGQSHLGSKGMSVKYTETNKYCCVHTLDGKPSKQMFNVDCEKPVAFSVTKDGQLFAIVEEKTNEHSGSSETQPNVLLFQHGQSQPFSTYTPSDTHFHPAAVCFWQEEGQEKLLVADTQNDSVHVVRLEDSDCCFERCLAAGNGNLLRPTALEADDQGNVWIGCSDGWILKCEKLSQNAESHVTSEGNSEESVSGSPLQVDNVSLTETVSQLSTE